MGFIPVSDADRKVMLDTIGISSSDKLFTDIPDKVRLKGPLNLPGPLSEIEVTNLIEDLAAKNRQGSAFIGAGAYRHYIPAAVDSLASRSEFYTAYTPYQAEVSQGTLAAVFEFQTMICTLTGMDVANASMYDGATALAEAAFMSVRVSRREKIIAANPLNPRYRDVLRTYTRANGIELEILEGNDGITDIAALKSVIDKKVSAVIIQNPNFFGSLENLKEIADTAHSVGAHLIVAVTEPVSLGLLAPPGEQGADIVCGEGQGFGNPVGFGGPMLGLLAAKSPFLRKMPGRLIGKTTDSDGNEAYVLTLQTREQHIRREKATSNICSNEGLCALRAVIYLSLIGPRLREIAKLNHSMTAYLKKGLIDAGFSAVYNHPYFNECVVSHPDAHAIHKRLKGQGIISGLLLSGLFPNRGNQILVNATELNTPEEIDHLIDVIKTAG